MATPGRGNTTLNFPPRLARWNQLDLAIVLLSIMGIALEEIEMNAALPINPTIIRIMRVLRIARGRWPLRTQSRVTWAVGRPQSRMGYRQATSSADVWDVCSRRRGLGL